MHIKISCSFAAPCTGLGRLYWLCHLHCLHWGIAALRHPHAVANVCSLQNGLMWQLLCPALEIVFQQQRRCCKKARLHMYILSQW